MIEDTAVTDKVRLGIVGISDDVSRPTNLNWYYHINIGSECSTAIVHCIFDARTPQS